MVRALFAGYREGGGFLSERDQTAIVDGLVFLQWETWMAEQHHELPIQGLFERCRELL